MRIEFTCVHCGNQSSAMPAWGAMPYLRVQRFCSNPCYHAYYRTPAGIEERFWAKVDRSGGPDACWPWTGNRDERGYGRFGVNYRNIFAHRYSYALVHGEIPPDLSICHSCDNPPCVNPAHLWAGTARENMQDAMRKERWVRGERQGHTRLTVDDVRLIRALRANGVPLAEVAVRYGMAQSSISSIVTRRNWKHVD